MKLNNSLGCGKEFNMHTSTGFICGVADGWGTEHLCKNCKIKLKEKWKEEDLKGGLK